MVSTCLRGRSLLGACLEKTEENKGEISTCNNSKKPRAVLCHVASHLLSFYVQATLSTIPCPNEAWSREEPHLECVGPSIIPLGKYLHKIDKPLCNSQKQSPWNSQSRAIYSYDQGEGMEPRERKADGGGTEDKRREHENWLLYGSKISSEHLKKLIKIDRQTWW